MTAPTRYQQRIDGLDQELERGQSLSRKLGVARVALALPGIALIAANLFEPRVPVGTWQLGALLLVAFLAVATWHENLRDRLDWRNRQRHFYRRLLARCERRWTDIPALESESVSSPFASELSKDLDLFGERSLFRWCSLAVTDSGAATIARWMTEWQPVANIEQRQIAVQELKSMPAWRQSYWDAAIGFRGMDTSPESIAEWGTESSLFSTKKWLTAMTWLGPIAVSAGLMAMLIGGAANANLIFNTGFLMFLAGVALNLLLTVTIMGKVHDVFVKIGSASRELQSLASLLQLAQDLRPNAPLLLDIQQSMQSSHGDATSAVSALRRRMSFAGIQRNPLFFIPYWIMQLLFLWDVRVLELLERWKGQHGAHIAHWIAALGRLEALGSSATIADENPTWAYPQWRDTLDRSLHVDGLGHPLLSDAKRVCNDLVLHASHPLLLVTGSNMAGKSTLLRSLGINTVLARLGAPVSCRSWTGPNMEIASSIRVQDSLQDGVSFFMAELKRLRSIVDFTQSALRQHARPTLVLLDEILQGTNSRERQIAVEQVLGQLVDLNALVVTSTHDLELARCQSLVDVAQIVHFREFFEKVDGMEVMRFDYVMRPGVTPTTNALKLLELVGLGSRMGSRAESAATEAESPTAKTGTAKSPSEPFN